MTLALFAAACGETKTQRATTGAAGGAVVGGLLGGPVGVLVGAGLGGAGGAVLRGRAEEERHAARPDVTSSAIAPRDRAEVAPAPRQSDLTNRQVREAQIALKKLGLYDGEIDGLYGRRTIAAVREFQAGQDSLPYTGTLDERTQREIRTAASPGGPETEGQPRPADVEQPPDMSEAAATQPPAEGETGPSEAQLN